ncbi:MAG: carbohydrate ABC transporter permease [Lachnospiraceae bacterium]|nr:carbohydrate ABC transporter permease [Lachnospiraceae bacterium]
MRTRSTDDYVVGERKNRKPQVLLYIGLILFTLICLLPLVLVIIISFSSQASIRANGYSFFPTEWTLDGYRYVLEYGEQVIRSYGVTIAETVLGTLLALVVTGTFAYTLSRKDFMLRSALSFYMLITMLLHGGLLSSYLINTNIYHLKDNFLILILPGCITAGNVIIMRTYIQSNVPDSLIESAVIDGAGELTTFFKVVLPLMKPSMAAVGFMIAIGHWNEWMTAMLYIDDNELVPLQLMLTRIEKNMQFLIENMQSMTAEQVAMLNDMPQDAARMAILICTLGPVLIIYPFFQKYFIKGMTMGAVKG